MIATYQLMYVPYINDVVLRIGYSRIESKVAGRLALAFAIE
jgi:hypothetical protein